MRRHIGRVVVLCVALVIVFAVLRGEHDDGASQELRGFAIRPLAQGFSLGGEDGGRKSVLHDILSGYPEPAKFRSVDIPGGSFAIAESCRDAYIAVILYARKIDYRKEPAAAALNQAYPCTPGKRFVITVDAESYGLRAGTYYIVVADQGVSGAWYNPR
ncbi:MAG: hypothetical protein IT406_03470 [Candidatus Yanofskybacteria bacterium]|nr:hypothetical protein [Candidatus Yanofskybacteria bacterium]